VSNISFSSLSADLGRTMYRYSFRIPPYYTLLVRSLSVLEGIALASDPNYKVGVCANKLFECVGFGQINPAVPVFFDCCWRALRWPATPITR
jgi:predicted unusual protein kinase regulating ubiquinone biosynthesis (AarF/ABC1/UbiB family)